MSQFFRDIWYGLQNFWKYRGLIWNDRDWDYCYLYQLMEFKLNQMARLQREFGISMDVEVLAAEMEEAAECLRRLHQEDYGTDDWDEVRIHMKKDRARFANLFELRSGGWWD